MIRQKDKTTHFWRWTSSWHMYGWLWRFGRKSTKFSFPFSIVQAKSQQNVCHVSSAVCFLNIPSCQPRFCLATIAIVLPKKMDNCCNIKTSRPENIDFCFSHQAPQCPCLLERNFSAYVFASVSSLCWSRDVLFTHILKEGKCHGVYRGTASTRFFFHVFAR